MKKYTIRTALLTCLALVMVLGVSVGPSLSYFTTYVTAQGGYTIGLKLVDTELHERVEAGAKNITIENTGEADCYVRVRIMAGSMVGLTYSGDNWSYNEADDYWYYGPILHPGETTTTLVAAIRPVEGMKSDYNVIVVEESTPVQYDGDQPYADWTLKAEEG